MTGNKHSNSRSGQVLLITLLVMATIITVIFSISLTSRTDTQTTILEEESQKALAAAEAGIQVALKKGSDATFGSGELSSISEFQGGAVFNPATATTEFLSPTIERDGEYTFYLGAYTAGAPPTFGPSVANDVRVCFGSSGSPPALDIALIRASDPKLQRFAVDPQGRIANVTSGSTGCPGNNTTSSFSHSYVIPGAQIGTDARFMIVKTLYSSSELLFVRASGSTPFPAQGTLIESSATSNTSGVTKKIELFQSHPQISTEFFSAVF